MLACISIAGRAPAEPLTRTEAFASADAASYYTFDACGDGIAGQAYRQALAARVAECPFTPGARAAYAARARVQRAWSAEALQRLIDAHGGLPVRLDGMDRTCREQQDDPGYVAMRARLDQFSRGALSAGEIVPAPCDAATVEP